MMMPLHEPVLQAEPLGKGGPQRKADLSNNLAEADQSGEPWKPSCLERAMRITMANILNNRNNTNGYFVLDSVVWFSQLSVPLSF